MYEYRATVAKAIDGDTVDLEIDCGLRIYTKTRIRLTGINAPEVSTPEGKEARSYLQSLLPPGTQVTVKTDKDRTEKYGRWLGVITTLEGTNVNTLMVQMGYAVDYSGGART